MILNAPDYDSKALLDDRPSYAVPVLLFLPFLLFLFLLLLLFCPHLWLCAKNGQFSRLLNARGALARAVLSALPALPALPCFLVPPVIPSPVLALFEKWTIF